MRLPSAILAAFAVVVSLVAGTGPALSATTDVELAAAAQTQVPWPLVSALAAEPNAGLTPALWQRFSVDGDGSGRATASSHADRAYTAAQALSSLGSETGGDLTAALALVRPAASGKAFAARIVARAVSFEKQAPLRTKSLALTPRVATLPSTPTPSSPLCVSSLIPVGGSSTLFDLPSCKAAAGRGALIPTASTPAPAQPAKAAAAAPTVVARSSASASPPASPPAPSSAAPPPASPQPGGAPTPQPRGTPPKDASANDPGAAGSNPFGSLLSAPADYDKVRPKGGWWRQQGVDADDSFSLGDRIDGFDIGLTKVDIDISSEIANVLANLFWAISKALSSVAITLFEFAMSFEVFAELVPSFLGAARSLFGGSDIISSPWGLSVIVGAGVFLLFRGIVGRRYGWALGQIGRSLALVLVATVLVFAPGSWITHFASGVDSVSEATMGAALASMQPSFEENKRDQSVEAKNLCPGALRKGSSKGIPGLTPAIDQKPTGARAITSASETMHFILVQSPWAASEFGNAQFGWEVAVNRLQYLRLDAQDRKSLMDAFWKGGQFKPNLRGGTAFENWVARNGLARDNPMLLATGALNDKWVNTAEYKELKKQFAPTETLANDLIEACPAQMKQIAAAQSAGASWSRLMVTFVVLLGAVGAILLIGGLSLAVIASQAVALVLIAITPLVVLSALIPGVGARVFGKWLSRLLAALLAKLVISLVLVLVMAIELSLTTLALHGNQTVGWLTIFVLQTGILWGAFQARRSILGGLQTTFARVSGGGGGADDSSREHGAEVTQGVARGFGRIGRGASSLDSGVRVARNARRTATAPLRAGRGAIGRGSSGGGEATPKQAGRALLAGRAPGVGGRLGAAGASAAGRGLRGAVAPPGGGAAAGFGAGIVAQTATQGLLSGRGDRRRFLSGLGRNDPESLALLGRLQSAQGVSQGLVRLPAEHRDMHDAHDSYMASLREWEVLSQLEAPHVDGSEATPTERATAQKARTMLGEALGPDFVHGDGGYISPEDVSPDSFGRWVSSESGGLHSMSATVQSASSDELAAAERWLSAREQAAIRFAESPGTGGGQLASAVLADTHARRERLSMAGPAPKGAPTPMPWRVDEYARAVKAVRAGRSSDGEFARANDVARRKGSEADARQASRR